MKLKENIKNILAVLLFYSIIAGGVVLLSIINAEPNETNVSEVSQ